MGQTLRILLVDDEDIVLHALGSFLRALGHQTDDAQRGEEALETLERGGYDLVMVDVKMPEMDGFEFLERARRDNPELPIVMMAGHGDPESVRRAKEMGAIDFMCKPFRLVDLEMVVAKAIGTSGASSEAKGSL
ncbi:MAG: response regulator [Candidatus Latescibacteria bacterium]|jgi:two-component system NtrC family response regulator|nr:response regulator [Candidatus Latescibacterota bacterium]